MNKILLESDQDYSQWRSIWFFHNNGRHNFGPPIKEGDPYFYYSYRWISNGFWDFGKHGFYIRTY